MIVQGLVLSNLGDGDMDIHYTILFTLYVFEISQNKKGFWVVFCFLFFFVTIMGDGIFLLYFSIFSKFFFTIIAIYFK